MSIQSIITFTLSLAILLLPFAVLAQTSGKIYVEPAMVGESTSFYGVSNYSESQQWTAYQDNRILTESEFFKITGYPEQAAAALKYENSTQANIGTGGLLFIVGAAVCIISLLTPSENTENVYGYEVKSYEYNTGLIYGGAIAAGIGGGIAMKGQSDSKKKLAPFGFAKEAAEKYNAVQK